MRPGFIGTFGASRLASPSPTPVPRNNAILLLHGNGGNGSAVFTDSSIYGNTVTPAGGAVQSSTQAKFGASSLAFTGTQQVLLTSSKILNQDFCFEAWVFITSYASSVFLDTRETPLHIGQWTFYTHTDGRATWYNDGANDIIVSTNPVPLNQWAHVAFTRASGTCRIFLNGVLQGSAVDNAAPNQTTRRIGQDFVGTGGFIGYMDEVCMSVGVAVYTANFTPPDAPFAQAAFVAPGSAESALDCNNLDGFNNTTLTDNQHLQGVSLKNAGWVTTANGASALDGGFPVLTDRLSGHAYVYDVDLLAISSNPRASVGWGLGTTTAGPIVAGFCGYQGPNTQMAGAVITRGGPVLFAGISAPCATDGPHVFLWGWNGTQPFVEIDGVMTLGAPAGLTDPGGGFGNSMPTGGYNNKVYAAIRTNYMFLAQARAWLLSKLP